MPGWTRDAKRVYKDDGTNKIQTVDYRVTPGTGIEMCVWNDFLPGTLFRGHINPVTPEPDMVLGATPGYFHAACPQDGQQHYWILNVLPWDSIHYTNGYNRYVDWTYQGYMTCGTSPATPPSAGQVQPTVLQPGMTAAQARQVCASKTPGRWVARKKRGKALRMAVRRKQSAYVCAKVKRKKRRPSITS